MKIIYDIKEMAEVSKALKSDGKTIGFVPTMGSLHEGHLSLIKKSRSENDIVVVSIFVNPTQFAIGEDLDKYPRDMKNDTLFCAKEKVDIIFNPDSYQMYPDGHIITVKPNPDLENKLCGVNRPGHFQGVVTVVSKLFDIVNPTVSYFGQKDAQQALIIKDMAKKLMCSTEIKVLPIVREKDGLAMSSRNAYLSSEERKRALSIRISLMRASKLIHAGEKDTDVVIFEMKKILEKKADKIDYIEIVNSFSLEKIDIINDEVLVAVAVWFGKTRLIDNIGVRPHSND